MNDQSLERREWNSMKLEENTKKFWGRKKTDKYKRSEEQKILLKAA